MKGEKNRRQTGSVYEKRAAEYLKEKGYQILEMNYRCRYGEIDIIAKDGRYLVFVEVKYRKNISAGLPEEAVNIRKQQIISKVAAYYCVGKWLPENVPCRFDVVAFCGEEVHLIQNAFYYQGNY